ncbi:MAG: hypothetical protein PF690_16315 [Deltaproteobacteria bacterium]|jgi:hypothetical protein|nr:hypothetical protein [Deltaproteobacteria bacterium]
MKKLIIMAASLALVAGFAMTAAAADWNFYGSSRVSTFWTNVEGIGTNTADVDQFNQGLQGNARIGANVKVSDELTGRFEYGSGVNLRLLYGTWNFGSGAFTVGQTYSPLNMFTSGQVFGSDTGLLNVGGVYSGREPVLQLAFGGFKVALVELDNADALPGKVANENSIPAIEASYRYSQDNWNVKVAGGYQTYEAQDAFGFGIDVDSYVVALSGGVNFGAFYVKGNVYTGENGGNLIALNTTTAGAWSGSGLAGLNAAGTDTDDNDIFGYVLVVGGKINDMFSVEAGYGSAEQELNSSTTGEDEVSAYYLNSTITLAPGVFVVPEIGMIDAEEDGQTELTYFGAKWQINF